MSDNRKFSSANKGISIGGGKASAKALNPKAVLNGLTKNVNKRWWMVGGLSAAVLVAVSTMLSSGSSTPHKAQPQDPVIDTTPKGISSEKNWKASTDADMLSLKQSLADSQQRTKDLMDMVSGLRKDMQQQRQAPQQPQTPKPVADLTLPPPPTPPSSLAPPPPPRDVVTAAAPTTAPVPPVATASSGPAPRSAARAFIADAGTPASGVVAATGTEEEQLVANDHQGFLPAGSFADATLISGVEAFTGGTAQAQPQPIVVRIDANAVLPNAAHYQVKGCHVLASVYGDMSSERVFGRLATLTCVDTHDKLVLSEDVEGVLVDSDGKNGIRGKLEDRQGAKLARSLLAGFAQGVGSAFGNAQSTFTQTPLGMTSTLVGANALRAGGYSGASTAAQQLADFYLKQAETTMPVIAVDAGRKVNVLFTKSKSLHFEATGTYRPKLKDKLTVEKSY